MKAHAERKGGSEVSSLLSHLKAAQRISVRKEKEIKRKKEFEAIKKNPSKRPAN